MISPGLSRTIAYNGPTILTSLFSERCRTLSNSNLAYRHIQCIFQRPPHIQIQKLSYALTWGQPGHVPPITEKRPCIYHFLPPFAPLKFCFAHPIFLTSLRHWKLSLTNCNQLKRESVRPKKI